MGKKYVCKFCEKKCKKRAVKVTQDQFYHPECFKCKVCHQQLPVDCFYKRGNDFYCNQDYHKLFGTWCSFCSKLIQENVVNAQGKSFHPECFKCSKCSRTILDGETAHIINKKFLCSSCTNEEVQVKGVENLEENNNLEKEDLNNLQKEKQNVCEAIVSNFNASQTELEKHGTLPVKLDTCQTLPPGMDKCGTLPAKLDAHKAFLPFSHFGGSANSFSNGIGSRLDDTIRDSSKRSKSFFGVPDNKFYNFSFLERTNPNSFRRGPLLNSSQRPMRHFHRPNTEFSYRNPRDDIMSEIKKRTKAKLENHEKLTMDNDGWPGPPEPAAVYPELLRDRSEDLVDGSEDANHKLCKEISELEKLVDSSGTASLLLKDLKVPKTPDPRDASRDPSAGNSLPIKLKHQVSHLASPSRVFCGKRLSNHINVRPSESVKVSKHSTLPRYYSLRFGRTACEGDIFENWRMTPTDSSPENRKIVTQEIDLNNDIENLKLKAHLKYTTLPAGASLNCPNYLDHLRAPSTTTRLPKKYSLAELQEDIKSGSHKLNTELVEECLHDEEFESAFKMPKSEFNCLPMWQKFEAKKKIQLA